MSRISTRSLINLCQRVGTAVRSGLEARKVWELEVRHSSEPLKSRLEVIQARVAAGDPVAEAMAASNGFFPPMFVQMVAVGEQTGKLDEVLLRMAEHYSHQQQMQRNFWMGIAWPLFELIFAVLIIGFLIVILGMIGSSSGTTIDILGLGLTGTSGAIVWFLGCGLIAAAIGTSVYALQRGWFGPKPVLVAMRIPVLGKCLESLALSRLTWSLAMALDSGMDARRAVQLSILAAQNPYYESSLARVLAGIRANKQFHESFEGGGVFPTDFLQQLEAAEIAGATTESLLRLARDYEDRARTAMRVLTAIATVAVMILAFGVIIYFIFTMAYHVYFKPINDALEMTQPGNF